MSTKEAPLRLGQSGEELGDFVEAMHAAQDAVRELQIRCPNELDRQVFDTINLLITNTASAIWDQHPDAGQFIEDSVYGDRA